MTIHGPARLVRITLRAAALALVIGGTASAAPPPANVSMLKDFKFDHPIFVHHLPFAERHLVLQVSQADPARWTFVLNNAQNVIDFMGADKVQIVVVTYGAGLKMLFPDSPVAKRIAALNGEGVEFDACHNTMMAMAKVMGHLPALVPAAVIVPAGVVRIMQLEAHGFAYIKP